MDKNIVTVADKVTDREAKKMLCIYCGHKEKGEKSTCENCEMNPDYSDCFELGEDAKKLIGKRVLNAYGCANLVAELNSNRLNRLTGICDNQSAVDSGAITNDLGGSDCVGADKEL